jgi:hypothetical protein|tara:strand:- start:3899 stop:4081 length:183 start_codon:yes stop_codon:yes gene_type:complete
MKDKKSKIYAVIFISEKKKTVSVHFDGFEDFYHAKDFSDFLVDEVLNIEDLYSSANHTIH